MTRSWRLDLPLTKPLSLNDRQHFMVRAGQTRTVRDLAALHARIAKIPPLGRCAVELHYVPRDKRRRDADNLIATLKPAADGLVDALVVADDTPDLMVKAMPVVDPADSSQRRSRLYLLVTELAPVEAS